jgi:predicted metal-binding membrane protein
MMLIDPFRKKRLDAVVAASGLTATAWVYLLLGAGMGMSPWAMTSLRYPPLTVSSQMQATWDLAYSLTMLAMWWVMMLAMMLPGLLIQVFREPSNWAFSPRFLVEYAASWFAYSVIATGLQFGFEQAGWLDGMKMWSTSSGFSRSILVVVIAAQLWRLMQPVKSTTRADERMPGSGFDYAQGCLMTTGPTMMLLFVGGVMNLFWIAALAIWACVYKATPQLRAIPIITLVVCIFLLIKT